MAALELGRRLARLGLEARSLLDRPELAAEFLTRCYAHERVELFGVIARGGFVSLRQRGLLPVA